MHCCRSNDNDQTTEPNLTGLKKPSPALCATAVSVILDSITVPYFENGLEVEPIGLPTIVLSSGKNEYR